MRIKKKLLVTAEPFAYGPSAKAVTICKNLSDQWDILSIARGTAAEFLSANKITVVQYDINNKEHIKTYINSCDAILNVMNFEIAEFIDYVNVPVIYIDTLFWFWYKNLWENVHFDKYFIQAFPGVRNLISKCQSSHIKKMEIVGPIVDLSTASQENNRNTVMVNFGGLESDLITIGHNSYYPHRILEMFTDEIFSVFKLPIIVTSRPKICEMLSQRFERPYVIFKHLQSNEFIHELSKSACLFTTPGLETIYEAFLSKIPIFFLPPSLNSQFYQLEIYKQHDCASHHFEWPDFPVKKLLSLRNNPKSEISCILDYLEQFTIKPQIQEQVSHSIRSFHNAVSNREGLTNIIKSQSRFMDSLGPNGTSNVCNFIENAGK